MTAIQSALVLAFVGVCGGATTHDEQRRTYFYKPHTTARLSEAFRKQYPTGPTSRTQLRGGGGPGSGLGAYGSIEEEAVTRLKKSHLAPTVRLYEMVHHEHDRRIGVADVKTAGL